MSYSIRKKKKNKKINTSGIGGQNITNNFYIDKIEKDVDIDDIVSKIEKTLYSNMKRSGAM